ncbi:CHAT domain-containing protein, partial [candidate division KSB1 bacterium]|nr:CHAT domain-containing protein [candidate division KSB1 bacterium]
ADSALAANTIPQLSLNIIGPPFQQFTIDRRYFIISQTVLAEIYNERYRAEQNIHDLYLALNASEKADSVLIDLRHNFKTDRSKLELAGYVTDLYSQAVRTSYLLYQRTREDKHKIAAFKYAEKYRAASLRESMNDSKAKKIAGLPDSVLAKERDIKIELSFYQNEINSEKLKGPECDSSKVEGLERKYYDYYTRYMTLLQDMEQKYPSYYNLKYTTQQVDVGRILRSLDRKTALIEFFMGKNELFTFVLTQKNLELHRLPVDTVLINSLEQYHKIVQRKNLMQNTLKKQFLDSSTELYATLVKPIEKYIRGKERLLIVPDGQIHYVPFETLVPIPYHAGELFEQDYLIHQYIISYQYSAQLFLENHDKKHQKLAFTGFAPVFDFLPPPKKPPYHDGMYLDSLEIEIIYENRFVENLGFGPLPESEKEVRDIIDRFYEYDIPAKGYFRWDATEERLKNLSSSGILHIATHGLFDEQDPELSGLLFSSPKDSLVGGLEVLFSGELYNLELPYDLVVLSSCGSGIGKIVRGEGVLSLTRAFYYAGASNLLFSMWKIADKHARLLMERFYLNVLEGQGYAEALRNAKVALLRDRVAGLPNHWGAFVLVGM